MAVLGLSPCRGRRTAQAWAEVATKQGDNPFPSRGGIIANAVRQWALTVREGFGLPASLKGYRRETL